MRTSEGQHTEEKFRRKRKEQEEEVVAVVVVVEEDEDEKEVPHACSAGESRPMLSHTPSFLYLSCL